MNTLQGTTPSSGTPTSTDITGDLMPAAHNSEGGTHLAHPPQTYGSYLKVPELLGLQSVVSNPARHDELLFIIVQQVQELWFKQILAEFAVVIRLIGEGDLVEATRLLRRANLIMEHVTGEVGVLETMHPADFLHFRGILATASGFESEQFRELEYASGLREPPFLNVLEKHMEPQARDEIKGRWPLSLREALLEALAGLNQDPVEALAIVYGAPGEHPHHFMLAEALSEYEMRFVSWRLAHLKVVERTIGTRTQGTAGSAGSGYLARTLGYRFFPELWEARNRLSEKHNHGAPIGEVHGS
jgi:tryptophan 2,3-dioxygenase